MTELAINFTDDDEPVVPPQLSIAQSAPAATYAPQGPVTPSQPGGDLPTFERAVVQATEIKISGVSSIDTRGELTVSLDDLVRAVGVFRVVKINHYVNKAGDVVRQQVLSPVEELEVVPFDSSNPNDDGIVRARP